MPSITAVLSNLRDTFFGNADPNQATLDAHGRTYRAVHVSAGICMLLARIYGAQSFRALGVCSAIMLHNLFMEFSSDARDAHALEGAVAALTAGLYSRLAGAEPAVESLMALTFLEYVLHESAYRIGGISLSLRMVTALIHSLELQLHAVLHVPQPTMTLS